MKNNQTNYIKNPKRNPNAPVKRKVYIPQYVQLGMEPRVQDITPTDFAFHNKKKPVNRPLGVKVQQEPSSQDTSDRLYVRAQNNMPQPTMPVVNSGRKEHAWYPTEEDSVEETEEYANSMISFDEIDIPGEENGSEQQEESQTISFENVGDNQYCLLLDNQILHICSSSEELEEVIEFVLYDTTSPFKGVDVKDLKVIKCLPIKLGVSIR